MGQANVLPRSPGKATAPLAPSPIQVACSSSVNKSVFGRPGTFLTCLALMSRDTQIGLLTINAARSATLPPELAQERDHLSLDRRVHVPR
jgi:hypothetical protein